MIKSQVKIGQKLRPGVKIGSLKNSEGIFLISINNFEKKLGVKIEKKITSNFDKNLEVKNTKLFTKDS